MKYRVAVLFSLLTFIAGTAGATNLGIVGGFLSPLGDFGDVADPSPYIGAHWEIQDVNARGQVAVLSFVVQGGFAFLQTDGAFQDALDQLGESGDGSYFDLGLAARVHSMALPVFVTAGAMWVNLNPAGSGDSSNGVGAVVGLGIEKGLPSFSFGAEIRATFAAMDNDESLQHLLFLATIGLPF